MCHACIITLKSDPRLFFARFYTFITVQAQCFSIPAVPVFEFPASGTSVFPVSGTSGPRILCYTVAMKIGEIIRSPYTDARKNLRLEQELFSRERTGTVCMLWRNKRTVVLGKNQNAAEEVDLEFARANGIRVVRRSTGGGAVYHDLGNINYTFLADYRASDTPSLAAYASPVAQALRDMGADAFFSGRNDILVNFSQDCCRTDIRKVCGTAARIDGDRILAHGCILFDVDLELMGRVLTPPPAKLARHGIASVKSRVGNLRELFPELTAETFTNALAESLVRQDLPF